MGKKLTKDKVSRMSAAISYLDLFGGKFRGKLKHDRLLAKINRYSDKGYCAGEGETARRFKRIQKGKIPEDQILRRNYE